MRAKGIFLKLLFFSLILVVVVFVVSTGVLKGDRLVVVNVPVSSSDVPEGLEPFVQIEVLQKATTTIEQEILHEPIARNIDIEPQKPLAHPPEYIKAVYATAWSAGSTKKMNYFIDLIENTELNAIVIDIKDYTGYVLYDTNLELVEKYNAEEIRISQLNALLKRLHDKGIYAIARISVFQDQRLALARPDLAVMSSSTQGLWQDRKGLSWIDASAQEAWDYNIAIAREAAERGFDEINFDYIRFLSDGDFDDAIYPFWNSTTTTRRKVIKDFFSYLRSELPGIIISADLFGLVTVNQDDLGIGQNINDAFLNFDVIAPMVYPSHYQAGSFGIAKPAENPYEIIRYSMDVATARRSAFVNKQIEAQGTSTDPLPKIAKFRPWIQDFDLGADYTPEMIQKQIKAVYDAATTSPESLSGWMLWSPSNIYTHEGVATTTNAL